MATPYLGEIRIMSYTYAPKGWAMCNGQFLPINQNQALFSLLGTTYGGNGQTTFALPNLRGRTPIHTGNGHTLGEAAGQESSTINSSQLPSHNHGFNVRTDAVTTNVPGNLTSLGNTAPNQVYNGSGANLITLKPESVSNIGGNQAHQNIQPYLVLNFCIALQGIFPSEN